MIKLNNSLQYCMLDTEMHGLSKLALEHSNRVFPLENPIILSDENFSEGINPNFHFVKPMSGMQDYNCLLLKTVPNLLTTDFILIIQYDGFVLSPRAFGNIFFDYDYIGAAWPNAGEKDVGNGGFSLRSKRLVEAVAQEIDNFDITGPEDILICRTMRPMLEEKYGLKFAPKEIANHFSREGFVGSRTCFGFHGIYYLPTIYKENLNFLFSQFDPLRISRKKIKLLALGAKALGELGSHAFESNFGSIEDALAYQILSEF